MRVVRRLVEGRTRRGKINQPVHPATVRLEAEFLAKKPKFLTSRRDQIAKIGFGRDRGASVRNVESEAVGSLKGSAREYGGMVRK